MTNQQKRLQLTRSIQRIDSILSGYVDVAWRVKARLAVTPLLQALITRHSLAIRTGGEGVSTGTPTGNPNQSRPRPKNPQWNVAGSGYDPKPRQDQVQVGPDLDQVQDQVQVMTEKEPESVWVEDSALAPQPVGAVEIVIPGQDQPALIWPSPAVLKVFGYCSNPKLVAAKLPDQRMVSMHRGMRAWRIGQEVHCRLAAGGGSPIYDPV